MIDVTPTDSDSLRDLRRIGPIAQAMFTVTIAIAACTLALASMAPAPVPAPAPATAENAPANAAQPLAAAPTAMRAGMFVPSSISSADSQPEALPPTF